MMNQLLRTKIESLAEIDLRLDGRKLTEFREPIEITYDVSSTAEGSAQVKIGGTIVIAGVKLSIEKPFPDNPNEGSLMVNSEMLPISNPEFESGPPNIDSIELSRVVDRSLRESKAIDFKELGIESGEKAWFISVDIMPLNDEGNLFDAAAIAALAAILNARFPEYDGTNIDYHKKTDKKVPIKKLPLGITIVKIKDKYFVDPKIEELKVMDARLTVGSTEDGMLCALQKGGEKPLTETELMEMIDLGIEKAKEIRRLFKK